MATLEHEREIGARAKALLDDDLLKAAFEAVQYSIHEQWEHCGDPSIRDRLWMKLQVIKDVYKDLDTKIQTGLMAAQQLRAQAARLNG